jgi:hypothetical protein
MAETKKQTKRAEKRSRKTMVALTSDGKVLVGTRRIASHKGEIVARDQFYRNNLRACVVVAKTSDGKLRFSTKTEAEAKGWAVVRRAVKA